jgi:hypothetical protein
MAVGHWGAHEARSTRPQDVNTGWLGILPPHNKHIKRRHLLSTSAQEVRNGSQKVYLSHKQPGSVESPAVSCHELIAKRWKDPVCRSAQERCTLSSSVVG